MNETSFSNRVRVPVFVGFVAYALLMRVLPYVLHRGFGMDIEHAYSAFPWNFSPIYAIAIFGGAMLAPRLAVLLPIAVFLASDVIISLLMGSEWGTYRSQLFTYASFALMTLCGLPLRERRTAGSIAIAGLGGAIVFFLVSNFGVWATGGGQTYPMTFTGLMACYVKGLPFFRPTLASLAIFLPILFSPLVLAGTEPQTAHSPVPAT